MKHLIRLYPKAWRDRYEAELAAFLERRRATLGEAFDLVRGAIDARLHSSLAQQLVFVPEIGFRPGSTRVLLEPVVATAEGTSVTIVAVAAGPDQTDLLFEWEPPDEHAEWLVRIDRSGVQQRPPTALDMALVVGDDVHAPLRVEHRFRSANGYDMLDLTFPAVAAGAKTAELRVTHGDQQWRVPFRLSNSDFVGGPALAEMEHEGITVRATAVARRNDQVVVALEARTSVPRAHISLLGSGARAGFPAKVKMRPRQTITDPVVLQDDHGRRSEELRRLRHFSRTPEVAHPDQWPLRVTSTFAVPHFDGNTAVLTVPSILIGEQIDPVVVDLRALPADVQLGSHRLRVLRTEASLKNPPRTRIVFQLFEPAGPRHFLGPGRLVAQGMPADLMGAQHRGEPDERQLMWTDMIIPNAPIVTLADGLVRVDGPWTLRLSLD